MHEKTTLMVRLLVIVLLFFTWLPSVSFAGGWYLVSAPWKEGKKEYKPNLSYPLKVWQHLGSFDSASACEARLRRELAGIASLIGAASVTPEEPYNDALIDATEQYLSGGDSSKIPTRLIAPILRAVLDFKPGYLSIATDDLRLK